MRLFTRFRVPIVLSLLMVLAIGGALLGRSGLAAHAVGANITLGPTSGPPTSVTTVSGTGFGPTESVNINFDAKSVGTATTDVNGAFTQKVKVPSNATPGKHTVTATGLTSGLTATATFLVQTNWGMFGFDPQHTHLNPYENVIGTSTVSALKVKWSLASGNIISSSPAEVNGIVYVGSQDGKLYALKEKSGKVMWSFTTGAAISTSPAVAKGIVYIGSDDLNVYALDAIKGTLKWQFTVGGLVRSAPVVANGVLYFGAQDGKLYALNANNGKLLWSFATGGPITSSPATHSGAVFVGSQDKSVYAINATSGTLKWQFATGNVVNS